MSEEAATGAHVSSASEWKARTRKELIARRSAITAGFHAQWSDAIETNLASLLARLDRVEVLGFYWPYKREFDPTPFVRRMLLEGRSAALPVVVGADSALEFRRWDEAVPMEPGAYGIPIPRGTAVLLPDIVLLPANGFDRNGFRLGYGGGFFDRTLATMRPAPRTIGIAFEIGRLDTIHPETWDIALDYIVTEEAAFRRGPSGLEACSRSSITSEPTR